MKTSSTLFIAVTLAALVSCQKQSPNVNTSGNYQGTESNMYDPVYPTNGCVATTVSLIAGQHIDAGTITVSNDENFIYVTYKSTNDYFIKETHLYVGNCEAVPVNKKGNPVPGQFPYTNNHDYATSYMYAVPIAAIGMGNCGCIAAHAALVKLDASGNVIESQTGWGNGTSIVPNNGSWGMKFAYCTCAGAGGE
jgi:hypothetical protein